MQQAKGMVLIFALIMLMIMTLVVSASLIIAQLSNKAAQAGQLQLATSQQALKDHLSQVGTLQQNQEGEPLALSVCPAQYAAWSGGALKCNLIQINTQSFSDNQLFYNSYTSLVLVQQLELEQD